MIGTADAVVIGSGPNGLAAAIRLAQAGRRVSVLEQTETPGGSTRSAELTLPGFVHDCCAAVFPLAVASPFLRALDLDRHGLSWVFPEAPLAHPLDDGSAVVLHRSVARTAENLGPDAAVYEEIMRPLVRDAAQLIPDLLAPPGRQRHPLALARFGQHAFRSATGFACSHFHGDRAQALLAGNAAHAFLPLEAPLTSGYGLFLEMLGHAVGWPLARGGAQSVTTALVALLRSLAGEVVLDHPVSDLADLPAAVTIFCDTDPRQLARIAGSRLPRPFRARLRRHRYGPGAFKVDYALDGPAPWRDPACLAAGTVHVGGTLEEIARAEQEVHQRRHPERPFVVVSQPSLFDPTRAPAGKHTLWAYCHVPAGSDIDMTERIERQIERFAPGFRDRVLARRVTTPTDLEAANPNHVGGAINGGVQDLRTYLRWLTSRPSPYATPDPRIFRSSAATPPGGGVHGMCGFHAVEFALRREGG